jgi:tricorn protease
MTTRNLACTIALAIAAFSPAADAGTRLLRFPDVCGDRVVFTYAGDLWTVSTQGGIAARLTAGPGLEQSARFSPDCSRIAFTGEYGGGDQVYVVPAGGGVPVQLTWYPALGPLPQRWGFDNQVYGWKPDGSAVLFRSWRESITSSAPKLYTVAAEGGMPVALPMPVAGVGRYSPDGRQIVYSPKFRDFRTWNRYQGGWAQDLFVYDLESGAARNITNDPRTDRDPVWIGDDIYYVSDRSGYLNLYRYRTGDGSTERLTNYRDSDARWASGDTSGRIVFEVNGTLHLYSVADASDRALDISVPSDLVQARAAERDVQDYIEDFALSANGKRALLTARGEVFSVPLEHGITLDLTHTPGAHEREASWSNDGRRIAYVSDAGGEEAIWTGSAEGGEAKALTSENFGRLYAPRWSPDGKYIAFVDSESRIRIVATGKGAVTLVADDPGGSRRDYAWSPGGHYLAFTLTDPGSQVLRLFVRDVAAGRNVELGKPLLNGYAPAFSPDGQYLYFLGDREWTGQLSHVEWNFAANRETGVFAYALRKDAKNPFAPRNDESLADAGKKGEGDKDEKDEGAAKNAAKKPVDDRIDFEDIQSRLVRAPIDPTNIDWFAPTDKALLYVETDAGYYGRDGAFKPRLMSWTFEDREAKQVYEGVDNVDMSGDGSIVLVRTKEGFKRIELADQPPKLEDIKEVSLDGLFARVDPKAEYAEVFREVWRRYRDHFYARNMHGYDWNALRARYEPLVADVGDRSDLNYLLGQMVGELAVGHSYVSGGDIGLPPAPHVGLIGARFALDAASGRYRIVGIMAGQNDEERYRSPLTEVGVDVHEGDYVLAINGQPLAAPDNPYRLLRTPAGQLVRLTVNVRPQLEGARTALVSPIDSEEPLNYYAWVQRNRDYVGRASNGRIGYLHIPDMGADGLREFIKWYYPQIHEQALIVDVRNNGGGNVSSMIIERLSRKLLGLDYGRGFELSETYPQETFVGHLAALCNGTTASDGDIFSYMFKRAGLGPLIGTRTWGGVVGINGWGPVIDGGDVYVPQFATASSDGAYVIEGHGVEPDIVVDEDVAAQLAGRDPQLDRAISELEKALAERPVALPPRPADPVKTP